MITRPVRVNFPCSFLSQINFRCRSQLCRTNINEGGGDKPFIWCPISNLCENQASNVVKKLDIHAIVRNKKKQDLDLTVYSCLRKSSKVATEGSLNHKKCNEYLLLLNAGQLLPIMPTKCSTSSALRNINTKENTFNNINEQICRHCNKDMGNGKHKHKSHLPSAQQLDDMMLYFMTHAPDLFTSSGWTYQKASHNIIFENFMFGGTRTKSLNAYIRQIKCMKLIARLTISNPALNILQINRSIADGTIHVRWQVHGLRRELQPFIMFRLFDRNHYIRYIDGYSIFYINSNGLYHRHILSQVRRSQNYSKAKLVSLWLAQLGLRQPELDGELLKSPVCQDGRIK